MKIVRRQDFRIDEYKAPTKRGELLNKLDPNREKRLLEHQERIQERLNRK